MAESGLLARSAAYLAAVVAQMVGTFAILPVLTRSLPADEYGSVVTALVIGQVLTFVVAAGMPIAILRTFLESKAGRRNACRVAGGALIVATAASGALLVGLPLWGPLVTASPEARGLLPLAVLVGWAQGALEIGQGLLRAAERPRPFVFAALLRALAGPVLGLGFVSVWGASAASYLSGLLLAAICAAIIAGLSGGVRAPDRAAWAKLRDELPVALPGIPHSLGMMALAVGDRLVIERVLGTSEAGRYHVAYLVGTVGIVVVYAVNNAWAPLVVGTPEKSRWGLHRRVTSLMVIAVGAVSATAAISAPAILVIALPVELRSRELVTVTGLVAIGALLFVLYTAAGHVLTAVGWTAPLVIVTPAVAVLNVLGNVVAVPRWGLAGAGATTTISYGVLAVGVVVVAHRHSSIVWPWRLVLGWLALTGTMAAVGAQLPDGRQWLLVRAALAAGVVAGAAVRIIQIPEIATWTKQLLPSSSALPTSVSGGRS